MGGRIADGYIRCYNPAGRRGSVPVRHEPDGRRAEKGRRQQAGAGALPAQQHAPQGRFAGHSRHRRDPVFLRHFGDGGGLCELRHDAGQAGHRRGHGRYSGHQRHGMDPVPVGSFRRERLGGAFEHSHPHRDRGHRRHRAAHGRKKTIHAGRGQHTHGVCRAHVRHVCHERRRGSPEGERSLHRHSHQLFKSLSGHSGGHCLHQHSSERFGRRGHFAGAGHYRRRHL